MSNQQLTKALMPMIERLSQLGLADAGTEAVMNDEFGEQNQQLKSAVALARQGVEEGWLCDRENAGAKFSRVAKPDETTHNFSIDAVLMTGEGAAHAHPNGEMSLCIAMQGEPEFDDFEQAWAQYLPGTSHTPTVVGGTMLFLYFLPAGAMTWI